jgi:hypothetical protein
MPLVEQQRLRISAIRRVSQKMSAPICSTGVCRYPPVSAIRSGFGITEGIVTDRQARAFRPKMSRIFSENGEKS